MNLSALRAECIRALSIVEQTQLELFRHVPVLRTAQQHELLDKLLQSTLENSATDTAVAAARQWLSDIVDAYGDPYAAYISPERHGRYLQRRGGTLVGVGLKFRAMDKSYPVVIGPLLGGPLDGRDVQPGDTLRLIDSTDVYGASSAAIGKLLTGAAGTSVSLVFGRNGEPLAPIPVLRRNVELHYARQQWLGQKLAYIKISRFGTTTFQQVQDFVRAFEVRGAHAYILDLRDNPGGSTRAARIIMSLFDHAGWVYCEQYKGGKSRRLPREGKQLSTAPIAILINERSLSSSEILAGALQSRGRAILVGAPSYGKGLIQKVRPLNSPLDGAVRNTIATYATPDMQPLHGRGLTPDIYVPTLPHGLHRETGSLNVSTATREFRRSLILERLRKTLGVHSANALFSVADTQLQAAIDLFD